MIPVIHHGTPLTPRAALLDVCKGRAMCVSFYRPDDVEAVEEISPAIMYDNGAFSFWMQQVRTGKEWDGSVRDWSDYYEWLQPRLRGNRWAIIPDMPTAPSQLNDALLNDWPHGVERGSPVWHMDGPLERLGRLCEKYARVCIGWVGETKADNKVGSDAFRRRMDEVAAFFGSTWPTLHMLRGIAVARDYPFRQRGQHITRAEWVAL